MYGKVALIPCKRIEEKNTFLIEGVGCVLHSLETPIYIQKNETKKKQNKV